MKWHTSFDFWARWRALAAVALLLLGQPAPAGAAARRPSARHGARRKRAHRAPVMAAKPQKARHGAHPASHHSRVTGAGITLIPSGRPPRCHPGLDLAFRMSGKRVPGR
jgi:hypothetical protein